MAIVLVTTVGAASANSYATLVEAAAVADEVFPPPAFWLVANADDQGRALIQARRELDQERFVGELVDDVQSLAWPRSGVQKPYYSDTYLTTEVPSLIKRAQILRAIYLVEQAGANGGSLLPDDLVGVSSFSLGGEVSVTLDTSVSSQSDRDRYFAQVIRPLLGGLIFVRQVRMVRG